MCYHPDYQSPTKYPYTDLPIGQFSFGPPLYGNPPVYQPTSKYPPYGNPSAAAQCPYACHHTNQFSVNPHTGMHYQPTPTHDIRSLPCSITDTAAIEGDPNKRRCTVCNAQIDMGVISEEEVKKSSETIVKIIHLINSFSYTRSYDNKFPSYMVDFVRSITREYLDQYGFINARAIKFRYDAEEDAKIKSTEDQPNPSKIITVCDDDNVFTCDLDAMGEVLECPFVGDTVSSEDSTAPITDTKDPNFVCPNTRYYEQSLMNELMYCGRCSHTDDRKVLHKKK